MRRGVRVEKLNTGYPYILKTKKIEFRFHPLMKFLIWQQRKTEKKKEKKLLFHVYLCDFCHCFLSLDGKTTFDLQPTKFLKR